MKLEDIVSRSIILDKSQIQSDTDLLKQIQSKLKTLGYYSSAIDGIPGPGTEKAIALFCDEHHLNNHSLGRYGATWAKALLEVKSRHLVTEAQAEAIFGRQITEAQLADLNSCLRRFEINTTARLRHWFSQICHESCCLLYNLELASGSAYEGREDLGNIYKGDGVKFKGCGWIQVTGREWHTQFSNYIGDPKVVELGSTYTAKKYPASISGFWWSRNSMNKLIDSGATVEQVTRRINGGYNGLSDRKIYYAKVCVILG